MTHFFFPFLLLHFLQGNRQAKPTVVFIGRYDALSYYENIYTTFKLCHTSTYSGFVLKSLRMNDNLTSSIIILKIELVFKMSVLFSKFLQMHLELFPVCITQWSDWKLAGDLSCRPVLKV